MNLFELFLLAIGLSMDAFAVSVCIGLTLKKIDIKNFIIVGLYFGGFQIGMPLIGYAITTLFAEKIIAYDHWIAFGLLCFLGVKTIVEGLKKEEQSKIEVSLNPKKMIPLAVATSIDALAVGISFAFLDVDIIPAVLFIGITTFLISMAGVKIGNIFGTKFKSKAEIAGGVILILIGVKILFEHMGILKF